MLKRPPGDDDADPMLPGHFDTPRARTRAVACLILAAALVMMLTCLVPGRVAAGPAAVSGVYAIGLAGALWFYRRGVGEWVLVGALVSGLALVTVLVALSQRGGSPDALFYLWVAPMSFFLTGRRLATLTVLGAALSASTLLFVPADADAVQTVIMTTGTLVTFVAWIAILRGRLESTAAEQARVARTDALTGAHNRMALLERAEEMPAGSALLLFDLDRFKEVNDAHGHAAGDHVLRTVVTRLNGCVREDDSVARLGGDEFAVLLAPGSDAEAVAARALARLREPVPFRGAELRPDASVGIAIAVGGERFEDLLAAADGLMYAHKRATAV